MKQDEIRLFLKRNDEELHTTSLVSLNNKYFSIKEPFYKVLKVTRFLKNFKLEL
jgi:hypothetical protein